MDNILSVSNVVDVLSWLIGYYEGEGHIAIDGRLMCVTTDKDIADRLCSIFEKECSMYYIKSKNHWSNTYRIHVKAATSRFLYRLMYLHMSQRRQDRIKTLYPDIQPIVTTLDDVSWSIGLLEAEGSFLQGPPSSPKQPRIQIQMKDFDTLQKLANMWKQKLYIIKSPKNPKHSRTCRIIWRSNKAIEFIRTYKEYFSEHRQKQITKVLGTYKYIPNRGETAARAKLTMEQVVIIRSELDKNIRGTTMRLAREFKVDDKTIRSIGLNKTYRV